MQARWPVPRRISIAPGKVQRQRDEERRETRGQAQAERAPVGCVDAEALEQVHLPRGVEAHHALVPEVVDGVPGEFDLQPRVAEGPVAYLERAGQACPDLARDLAAIRSLYVDLRYGPRPSNTDLRRLKYLVNRLRT
jgi:hypothetical protein